MLATFAAIEDRVKQSADVDHTVFDFVRTQWA